GCCRARSGCPPPPPGCPSTGMPMSCSATAYRRIVRSVTPRSVAAARPSTTDRVWSISRKPSRREAGRDILQDSTTLRTKSVLNHSYAAGRSIRMQRSEGMDDGRHDFDFLFGAWQIANRKRANPLVPGDDEWIEFDSFSVAQPI